jgi:UDP-2,3-diacylglucosamine pyrophosphatase LpxH
MKNNVCAIDVPIGKKTVLLLSDLHWDNPHCDRELLKKHLDQAVERNADILINGDLFCVMNGKADRRSSKSNIRPEHQRENYFDTIVNTAIDWFKPYAAHIKVVGYGNHETAILKYQETDLIERFVFGLNRECGTNIQAGGYGGWVIYSFVRNAGDLIKTVRSFKIKYFHGSGGGGPVTKGVIQFNRMATFVEGADMIWMGHVHEDNEVVYTIERLNNANRVQLADILMVRTSTYKEEYNNGAEGWHVERGASPKPLGGRWLELECTRATKIVNGQEKEVAKITAYTHRTT